MKNKITDSEKPLLSSAEVEDKLSQFTKLGEELIDYIVRGAHEVPSDLRPFVSGVSRTLLHNMNVRKVKSLDFSKIISSVKKVKTELEKDKKEMR
jgi:hypothetical protein